MATAALRGVLRIAEMLFHLDLQPGLKDLLGQNCKQPIRTNEVPTVISRLIDELLGHRLIQPLLVRIFRPCRHRHIMIGHGCPSFPPSEPLSVSGQTSHTEEPSVMVRSPAPSSGGLRSGFCTRR